MNSKKLKFIFSIFLFITLIISCSPEETIIYPQEEFGNDSNYFIGLRFLQEGKENQARLKFEACLKKGSYYCAKRSAEQLILFGTNKQKEKACKILVEKYNDEESLIQACKFYSENYKFTQIIDITNNIDYKTSNNELCKLRLLALQAQDSLHYSQDVFTWFSSRPISKEHLNFYVENYKLPPSEKDYTIRQFLISFRIDVYNQDYNVAFQKCATIFKLFEKKDIEPYEYIVSDIGKSYLYGSDDNLKNAQLFIKYANQYKSHPAEFYFYFYAGRFYDKEEKYFSQAIEQYNKAILSTEDSKLTDNALWYLLQSRLNQSYKSTINDLQKYAKIWTDASYFDDLFNSFIPSLLSGNDFDYIKILYEQIKDYASDDVVSKLAYINARLMEEGFIKSKNKEEIQDAYKTSISKTDNPYYKILSAYRLNYSDEELKQVLLKTSIQTEKTIDENAEILLRGYMKFGFPDLIYDEWVKLYKNGISIDTSMEIAEFLQSVGKIESKYKVLSLRISARSSYLAEKPLTIDQLKLIYPQYYYEHIEEYSKKYDIDSYIIYALIRSESFFDQYVISTAGAIGLTQLMQMTAQDIAGNLKIADFDLTDAKTNIEFGTYYLTKLISRCNDSLVLSFCSYNAGITRVRKWKENLRIYKSKQDKPPMDLFIEALPYTETRDYGKKLISSSLYYKWIYDYQDVERKPCSFAQITDTFLR